MLVFDGWVGLFRVAAVGTVAYLTRPTTRQVGREEAGADFAGNPMRFPVTYFFHDA